MKTFLTAIAVVAIIFGVRYFYLKPAARNGDQAPSFQGLSIDGDSISIDAFRNDYVLVHFWGSWCGSCRQENKLLTQYYEDWKNQRFGSDQAELKILSIGLEKSEKSWLKAIEGDQLEWDTHIFAEGMFEHPIPQLFGLKKIPALFLVDPNGVIVASDPELRELEKLLRLRKI